MPLILPTVELHHRRVSTAVHKFLTVAIGLSALLRRPMASYAAAGTRYAVELLAPIEGPVLGVGARDAKASARSTYRVLQEPAGAPFDGLQVCVWVDSTTEAKGGPSRAGPFCFEGPQRQVPIDGLAVGSHRLSAVVVAPSQGDHKFTQLSEVTTARIDVVLRQEFVPSYEWQQVYPWQSVPPGLDIQLPLGDGQKRARVPPSWRLQLYIPGGGDGGGFFVRTDVRAGSTVLELRREIARHPRYGLPVESVRLSLGGKMLGDQETAEGLDLFNRQRELTPVVDPRRGAS